MTQIELYNHLKSIGLPVFITIYKNPTPPYLIYLFSYSNDLIADNHNYKEISYFQIELYTTKKTYQAKTCRR